MITKQNIRKFALGLALLALASSIIGVPSDARAAAGDNIILNPDVETTVSGLPQYWRKKDNNSSNKVVFTYPVAGFNSAKAVKVQVSTYTGTGDEGWYFNDVPVIAGKKYTFTDKYISNAESSVRIRYKYSNGSTISPKPYLKVPAAAAWTDYSTSFTVPVNVVSVTIFHMLKSVGVLTTDTFSLRENVPPAAPSITSFSANPSIVTAGATSTLSWVTTGATSVSVNQGVGTVAVSGSKGVSPAITTVYTLTAVNTIGTTTASTTVTVNPVVPPPALPTVNSFTATPSSVTLGATSTLAWTTTGATFLTVDQGVGVVTANNSRIVSPVATTTYTISAGNVTGTTTRAVTVGVTPVVIAPPPPPSPVLPNIVSFAFSSSTVSAGSPTTLSWEVTNASTTSIDQGIGFVTATGTRSVTVVNTVTFTMTAVSPVGTTTRAVTLTVTTPPPPPPSNSIANPSFEIPDGLGGAANWHTGSWGTNTTAFNYLLTGFDGTRSSEIVMSAWTDGDAKWFFDDVAVGAGKQYVFTNHYKSTTDTWLTARYTSTTGVITYVDISSLPSSGGVWTQISKIVAPPIGTASITIFHLINKVGTLTTDAFSFIESDGSAPDAFDKGYVSITIDDGWTNQYTTGLPILTASGLKASFFIISDEVQNADSQGPTHEYMNVTQMLDIQSKGHEVSSHTKTHPSLIALSAAAAQDEITGSRTALQSLGVNPADTFVYPFGDQNASVVQYVKNAGYIGARGVEAGFNTKASNKYILQSQNVGLATTVDQVKAWVDAAAANKTWLILTFHLIDTSNDEYSVTPANFQAIIDYLKTKGIAVITMKQGLQMMP